MKKTILSITLALASVAALAGGVNVATVTAATTYRPCDGGATGSKAGILGGSGAVVAAGNAVFARGGFEVQCSNNVHLGVQEIDGNLAVVASGSVKGNQYFDGHTNGGAISAGGKCGGTNNSCGTTDVDAGITAAIAAGSGSGS